MTGDELCFTPAVELAAAIVGRRLSPVELMEALLARIERVNPRINAYCTVDRERALAAARAAEVAAMRGGVLGPLHGVPLSIKDATETAGLRTTYGSPIFADHVPVEDAIVVERARRAGAIVLGKTNTPEFAAKGTTDNRLFGVTRNPWNVDRVAGGSSGGAAAAVAAGISPLAEGSDLAGSVRIPAACCGVVGFRPSLGVVPCYPTPNAWTTFLTHGPLARTVGDAALLLGVMAGADARDPQSLPLPPDRWTRVSESGVRGLRLAWTADLGYAAVNPEVAEIAGRAARALQGLGAIVDEAAPGFEDARPLFIALSAPWRAGICRELPQDARTLMEPALRERIAFAESLGAVDYELANHRRTTLWHVVRRFFERFDLLLTPTTSVAAFPVAVDYPEEIAGRRLDSQLDWYPFTFPFSMTGQPSVSVPCGFTHEGLPVGLQIVGRRFEDQVVLSAAAAFEAAHPWTERRPPV